MSTKVIEGFEKQAISGKKVLHHAVGGALLGGTAGGAVGHWASKGEKEGKHRQNILKGVGLGAVLGAYTGVGRSLHKQSLPAAQGKKPFSSTMGKKKFHVIPGSGNA